MPGKGYLFLSCWPVGSPRLPNVAGYSPALQYPPEIDGEILSLKTPHPCVIKDREINQVLIWKHHDYYKAFLVLEGVVLKTRGKSDQQSYVPVDPMSHNKDCSYKIWTPMQERHEFYGNNQPLSYTMRWNSGLAMTPRPRNFGQVSHRP